MRQVEGLFAKPDRPKIQAEYSKVTIELGYIDPAHEKEF